MINIIISDITYIYIYIKIKKRRNKYIYPVPATVIVNRSRIKKLKMSNGIQYKPQKRTFQTINKFFSCYMFLVISFYRSCFNEEMKLQIQRNRGK